MVAFWTHLGIQKKIFAGLAMIVILMVAIVVADATARSADANLSDALITRLLPARAAVRSVKRLIVSADDDGAWYLLARGSSLRSGYLRGYRMDVAEIEQWLSSARSAPQTPQERAALDDFSAQQSRWSKGFMQVARKLLGPIWKSDWSDEAKFTTTVALGQQLIFPVLIVGVVALILSVIGHGYLTGFFRFLLWLWLCAMLAVLVGMTWGAYRRLQRGDLARYLITAASVPALIVYLAAANAGAIVGAGFGRKTGFNRTPKTGT